MNIYYLGPQGSYSHILTQRVFSQDTLVPLSSFTDIVAQIMQELGAVGILGIENSTSSSVHESVDLVFNNDLTIIGEASMRIGLCLIGKKGSAIGDISDVYSHSQALAQCKQYIADHDFHPHETVSTTAAAQHVIQSSDTTDAALAGAQAVTPDLMILDRDIEDTHHNMTRWIFVARLPFDLLHKKDKMTVIFRIKHVPGSLVRVLQAIAKQNGNLTKIESRPVPGTDWEYEFWVDIEFAEGNQERLITALQKVTSHLRVVGVYKKGEMV